MSESAEVLNTPSPDYFEKAPGTKRVNRLPIYIGSTFFAALLLVVGYNMHDKSMASQAKAAEAAEIYKISNVATPPVVRPSGPDVNISNPAIIYNSPAETPHGAPLQEDEAQKKARVDKMAALDAALKSTTSVDGFKSRPSTASASPVAHNTQQPTYGMPPPPPPAGQLDDGMGLMGGGPSPVRNHSNFSAQNDSGIYLMQSREAALSPMEVKAGSIIPGVMITGINSDLPGPIIGQVRQNVYDSATGRHLLIPAAAKLIGSYDSNVVSGEERVLIAWNRIIFPDGSSITLNNMPGADQSGYAGFSDQVNNHYWRTFGNAIMLSVLSAGMQIGQRSGSANGQLSATQIAAAAASMQFGYLGMQTARRGLNMPPTMEIRPGFEFNIMITKDMILPPWRGSSGSTK